MLSTIFWDPSRVACTIPGTSFDIYWYSIFFACGFAGASWVFLWDILYDREGSDRATTKSWCESLLVWLFLGAIVGARIGHVLFYEPLYYWHHPEEIIMIRNGGLASHGGVFGLILAAFLYFRYTAKRPVSFYELLDSLAPASSLAATFIRIGNFFNQEIVGTTTSLPFGIIFGHPMEDLAFPSAPHHPVQLYEATNSALLFFILILLRKRVPSLLPGQRAGGYLVALFLFRICIEAIKMPQSPFDTQLIFGLHVGQLLSIPCVLYGLFLIVRPYQNVSS